MYVIVLGFIFSLYFSHMIDTYYQGFFVCFDIRSMVESLADLLVSRFVDLCKSQAGFRRILYIPS